MKRLYASHSSMPRASLPRRVLLSVSIVATLVAGAAVLDASQVNAQPGGAASTSSRTNADASAATGADPGDVRSLRRAPVDAPDPSGEGFSFRNERDHVPSNRAYVQQPPLIPHTIKGYTITKNFNKCMDCHSWSRAREMGATKISLTHFRDRDGSELGSVSPRRYFCLQCHVPQTEANPLIENTFKPAYGLR